MKMKQTALAFTIMIFMVFAISIVTENSYAYWASNISAPVNVDTTGTVGIGTWTFAQQYDPNTSYNVGDRVTNNGVTYEAKKSGFLNEPGVESGWKADWNQL